MAAQVADHTHRSSSEEAIGDRNEKLGHHHDIKHDVKHDHARTADDDGAPLNWEALAAEHGYHETRAGRVVVDPAEAEREFGPEVSRKLKLNRRGDTILWPQPTNNPEDPQNWSSKKKLRTLAIITAAAIVPDFCSGIGIASLVALAKQFHSNPNHVNNLTSNWSIFLLGPGGIAAIIFAKRFGRLPVLFWTQLVGLGFLIGCAVAPTLTTFAAMRCLNGFFATAPQVMGLYTVTDMYPFHLQARMLNAWTMGFIASPFLSPWLLGYMVAKTSWRWCYGVGCIYVGIVLFLITFFMEETMYDRHIHPVPQRPSSGMRYRIETLIGITGWRMRKYRVGWVGAMTPIFDVLWRPQFLPLCIYILALFGFGIGINVTNVIFVSSPPPLGYGMTEWGVASTYATPVVAVIIGELAGRYINDFIANRSIKRNHGVFEAETRLWTLWIAMPFYVAGFTLIGAAYQKKLSVAALVFGWGMAEFATMVSVVAMYNYTSNCFPNHSGELSALLNFARVLGGFAVPYFQVNWVEKHGALQTFGCEGAVVAGLFFLLIPLLMVKGKSFRDNYSIKKQPYS